MPQTEQVGAVARFAVPLRAGGELVGVDEALR